MRDQTRSKILNAFSERVKMKRRDFICDVTLGLAGAAICTQLPETLFASPYGKPVGLQLYTLRDQLEKDAPGTIKLNSIHCAISLRRMRLERSNSWRRLATKT